MDDSYDYSYPDESGYTTNDSIDLSSFLDPNIDISSTDAYAEAAQQIDDIYNDPAVTSVVTGGSSQDYGSSSQSGLGTNLTGDTTLKTADSYSAPSYNDMSVAGSSSVINPNSNQTPSDPAKTDQSWLKTIFGSMENEKGGLNIFGQIALTSGMSVLKELLTGSGKAAADAAKVASDAQASNAATNAAQLPILQQNANANTMNAQTAAQNAQTQAQTAAIANQKATNTMTVGGQVFGGLINKPPTYTPVNVPYWKS